VIFQDFPGPGIFKKTNPGLSRRRGNPAKGSFTVPSPTWIDLQKTGHLHRNKVIVMLVYLAVLVVTHHIPTNVLLLSAEQQHSHIGTFGLPA